MNLSYVVMLAYFKYVELNVNPSDADMYSFLCRVCGGGVI